MKVNLTLDELAGAPERARGLSSETRAALTTKCAAALAALSAAALDAPPTVPDNGIAATPVLLTGKQIAEALNVKPSLIMSAARAGKIPRHAVGRYVRFNLLEVQQTLGRDRAARKG